MKGAVFIERDGALNEQMLEAGAPRRPRRRDELRVRPDPAAPLTRLPAARLVGPERREAGALQTRGLPVGTFPGLAFPAATADVAPGSRLYLFSDGVYEIVTREGRDWSLAAFQELVLQPPQPGLAESARLRQAVGAVAGTPELPDDFSLLVAAFD